MKYNYKKEIVRDIRNYIRENMTDVLLHPHYDNIADYLYNVLLDSDVTGSINETYTHDNLLSMKYVLDNMDLVSDISDFYNDYETIGYKFSDNDFDFFDVMIRRFLLIDYIFYVVESDF